MANKIETSSKNIKPRINLNHNIDTYVCDENLLLCAVQIHEFTSYTEIIIFTMLTICLTTIPYYETVPASL